MTLTAGPSPPRKGNSPDAYILAGPTAVGKTGLAHHLARRDGYAILSADALLVYRGMDIGTAKPTARQQREVPYYGLDLTDPGQTFSVSDYLAAVTAQLAANPPPRWPLLVVGGSGLTIKALIRGLDPGPPPDPRQRQQWETLARDRGPGALRDALRQRAPAWLAALPDKDNPRRLIRALEWAAAGYPEPPHSWQQCGGEVPLAGLTMAPARLRNRIAARVHEMIDAGLWAEAAALNAGGGLSRTARQAIGYAEALDRLAGKLTDAEAIDLITTRTRRLAKRQMTWFRHQATVEWIRVDRDDLDPPRTDATAVLDELRPIDDIITEVTRGWDRHGPCRLHGLETATA